MKSYVISVSIKNKITQRQEHGNWWTVKSKITLGSMSLDHSKESGRAAHGMSWHTFHIIMGLFKCEYLYVYFFMGLFMDISRS